MNIRSHKLKGEVPQKTARALAASHSWDPQATLSSLWLAYKFRASRTPLALFICWNNSQNPGKRCPSNYHFLIKDMNEQQDEETWRGTSERYPSTGASALVHTSQNFHKFTAAAAKLLQSCPTLCSPIDGNPTGSPVPGILQARALECVAISFSSTWKWKVKVKLLSRVRLLVTTWTIAHQAPPPMGFSRHEYWSGVPLPSLISSLTREISHFLNHCYCKRGHWRWAEIPVWSGDSKGTVEALPLQRRRSLVPSQ